jgi:hypothetical protein
MPGLLDQMTPSELQFCSALLMRRAGLLEKGDPKAAKLLQAAKQLLDRARESLSKDGSGLPPSRASPPTP